MSWLTELISWFTSLFGAFQWGRADRDADLLEEENEVLRKQRDNDVHSVADADRVWDEWKK